MKRYLIVSITLNVILVLLGLYGARKIVDRHKIPPTIDAYMESRKKVLESMPIHSDDVVFVGNSITERFLVTELFGSNFKNRGISGSKSTQILERIEGIAKDKPKKIFLMIGVNDIKANYSLDTVLLNTSKIVDIIRSRSPGTAIFIQSVLPTGGDFDYLNESIFRYNSILKNYCSETDVSYIDLHQSFVKAFDSLTYDGLHPNAEGYNLWKELIIPYL